MLIRLLVCYLAWFCWICNPAGLSISIYNAQISDCKICASRIQCQACLNILETQPNLSKSLYSNAVGLQIRPNQMYNMHVIPKQIPEKFELFGNLALWQVSLCSRDFMFLCLIGLLGDALQPLHHAPHHHQSWAAWTAAFPCRNCSGAGCNFSIPGFE